MLYQQPINTGICCVLVARMSNFIAVKWKGGRRQAKGGGEKGNPVERPPVCHIYPSPVTQ